MNRLKFWFIAMIVVPGGSFIVPYGIIDIKIQRHTSRQETNIMKRFNRILFIIATALLASIAASPVVYANSAEPPSFTVIVTNPPSDLSLTLQLADETQSEAIALNKEQKAWEAYYRFFYHMSPNAHANMEGAVLIVQAGEKSFQCPLPAGTFNTYNNLLTLDMGAQSLSIGQPPLRVPSLIAMRIVLTLAIEGLVFFLFGFRQKKSWLIFFYVNIITQGALNLILTGPNLGAYWMFGFILGEIVVLAVELLAFIPLVKEFGKLRTAIYTVVANVASLIIGGLLLSYLPV